MGKATLLMLAGVLFVGLYTNVCTAQLTLQLDPMYSPPAMIPSNPRDMIYSAPVNDHMLKPVKVIVLSNGVNVMQPVVVTATTILASNLNSPNTADNYTGILCQHNKWTHRYGTCRYMDNGCIELNCNTTDPMYPMGKVEVTTVNGVAVFERLLHTMYTGSDDRRLRFYVEVNGTIATVDSNPFQVDLAAASLEIVSMTNLSSVEVNQPLSFTVQTMAEDPNSPGSYIPLTTGRHSVMNVDLTVAWDFKNFYIFFPGNVNFYQFFSSSVTLAGSEVVSDGRLDYKIRKQCVNGSATFSDVRILEEVTNLQLNFTQTLSYYPWERVPPNYNETIMYNFAGGTFKTSTAESYSSAVAFTPPFNVSYGVMSSLQYDPTSGTNFVPTTDANFRFKTPLKVRAVSSSGLIITDGPDSTLSVTVHISPNTTCLSVDSDFTLVRGEGTFLGSICEVGTGIQLRFSVTDSQGLTHYTSWTTAITVSGDFRLAAIFNINADVNFDLFTEAAITLVNRGYWNSDFPAQGRLLSFDYYWMNSQSPQESLRVYDQIRAKNVDPNQPSTVRSIIGAVGEEDTIALSRASKRHEMPIMGYQSEKGDLSDKSAHPFYNRVSFSERIKYYAEGAYLASHRWNKVVVIKDSNHPIPVELYQGFEAHGVSIALEATVPALSAEPTDFSTLKPLDEVAEHIKSAGTRVIYALAYQPSDIYLYREAIRLEFAPSFGYIWLSSILILASFPFSNNRGNCASLTPTCTTAFNSTTSWAPSMEVDITKTPWSDALYDAYTQVDPLKLPSATIWRWPSVYGGISKPHDGAVATVLGAMQIINRQETITGAKLAVAIRNVTFEGASGKILFDQNGDRPGYTAAIYNYNPISNLPAENNEVVWVSGAWNLDPVTLEVTETQYNTRLLPGNVQIPGFVSYPPIEFQNERVVQGYRPGSTVLENINDLVPAAYWCTGGCGGGLAPYTNGTIYYYNYGTCASQDNCVCMTKFNSTEPGYAGSSCQQILCDPQCRNGECIAPDNCTCEPYWTGADCGTPLCTVSGCHPVHGNCTGPNICTCQSGYWGSDCSQRCTCVNGLCNDGQGGTGVCAECFSGYIGANCDLSIPLVVVPTLVAVAAIVTLIVILSVWYIRRMRFQAALANNDWIVDYNDVVISADGAGGVSMAFRSMVSLAADTQRQKDVVRNQGTWNSTDVSIKMIDKDSIVINTALRLEVKAMRDIRHQNLASFVGACCDTPNLCILMQTAPKGSLDDILAGGSIALDWNFKFSLLKDICRGMHYLSSTPIKSHGRLKSSNCVIDNRWTLKVTDYGMQTFKANQNGVPKFNPLTAMANSNVEDGTNNSVLINLLYTAPELLRTGVTHLDHVGAGTIQADMYSLGIIMCEVLTMEAPFQECLDYVEVKDILDAIAGKKSLSSELPPSLLRGTTKYFRPGIPEDANIDFAKLMKTTWDEDPNQRPTFQQVLKELNSISPQRGDLMDNLVNMLEKYSTNLEAVVAERTQELAAEKAKTEELVCRMLPRAIAEQLKRGEAVSAESFDCVTIYFSDIVGFTKIAGGSTPLQVVDLLNDLYTCFDAIIDHFDVYKVETIGDAYMVVSGLPLRNGDQHAGEIASMSLHLLSAILSFKIRHMPEANMQLRIGIHSGPVVAGVVGLKMPRYCLFGDTVNTASRMESGGLALKIHMSESTATLLEKLGGYQLQCRGAREVKGKGTMTTYWLKNKEGFSRPLPTEDMAVSESQHEFK